MMLKRLLTKRLGCFLSVPCVERVSRLSLGNLTNITVQTKAKNLISKRTFSINLPYRCTFRGEQDIFDGVTVDTSVEKCEGSQFQKTLQESLQKWNQEGKRCIWFRVNIKDSCQIPQLANKGFTFHHARDSFVMMYKWLPTDSEPNLPPSCHTNLGVGAMVFNDKRELLTVSEKHYNYPHWKLPGGYVEKGEDITHAAQREVKEETGIDSEFQSLVTFRHTHSMLYGNSDIYVLVMMKATSNKIAKSHREVADCKWMSVDEYTSHPHVHEWNRLVVKRALEYKSKGLKLDFQRRTVRWGQNKEREMSFLLIEKWED